MAFSHDLALVASTSYDETVRIWRADTGEYMQELKGHRDWVYSVAFAQLYFRSICIIRRYSLDLARHYRRVYAELKGHSGWVSWRLFHTTRPL